MFGLGENCTSIWGGIHWQRACDIVTVRGVSGLPGPKDYGLERLQLPSGVNSACVVLEQTQVSLTCPGVRPRNAIRVNCLQYFEPEVESPRAEGLRELMG